MNTSKTLVAYFSCTGTTERAAAKVAKAAGADLFRIVPEQPYTASDLDWNDSSSRCNHEHDDPSARPAIASHVDDMDAYDTVFLGFPIWWYVAPNIVSTFLEGYDLAGKTVVPFATSGGSGMGKTLEGLKASCSPAVKWRQGTMLTRMSSTDVATWVESLGL